MSGLGWAVVATSGGCRRERVGVGHGSGDGIGVGEGTGDWVAAQGQQSYPSLSEQRQRIKVDRPAQ